MLFNGSSSSSIRLGDGLCERERPVFTAGLGDVATGNIHNKDTHKLAECNLPPAAGCVYPVLRDTKHGCSEELWASERGLEGFAQLM